DHGLPCLAPAHEVERCHAPRNFARAAPRFHRIIGPGRALMQFGKYELTHKIATGGMAETWLGSFTGAAGISKTVVVKRIRPELAGDSEFVHMFINEARIAVSLSHGNIVQVFDFGEVDGEYFLAM